MAKKRYECDECWRDLTHCDRREIEGRVLCEYCWEDLNGIEKED